jgi:hypothetical protein
MINIDIPANQRVIYFVTHGAALVPKSNRAAALFVGVLRALDSLPNLFRKPGPIAPAPDHFKGCGGHPEYRERFWELGAVLPPECRVVLFGRTPAFVHPNTGVIFGVLGGLEYFLRIPPDLLATALTAGAKTSDPRMTWTDTKRDLGEDWIIAPWTAEETTWVKSAYERFGSQAPSPGMPSDKG